eukprot:TRINITY_DN7239_c0_g1_i1.p1 TRINITY_DN7239_c0_g1~~TRINITY_DN7239_c0_g1_i1.p1  ORF type:complete len:724 (-),score=124.32 TRINITY_DN7239_c0_g1_i1:22-2148(-)
MGSKSLAHNVRLFNLEPRAAHGLCLDPSSEILALARTRNENSGSGGNSEDDSSEEEEAWIEIWSLRGGIPFFQAWLPTGESSLEALAFGSGGRIYSTGLHGWILAHEIKSGALKKIPVSWGPSWCLDFHVKSQRLAVGTEEGVVCLFRENAAGLVYEKCLDKQEGRILCIAWEPNLGNKLVTGSTDTLRIWDTVTGHPLHRLSTARTFKSIETTVWSIAYLNNEIILSGDSRGKTSFWNGKTGTLLDSYQTHKADVLTVAVNHEKNIAYSTGVDPVVMHFQPILHKDGRSKWIKSIHKTWNHHDNRSILPIDPNTLALVGIDSFLRFVAPKNKYVYAPLPYGESVSLSPDIRCLLFRYSNSLELWKLGSTKEDSKTALSGAILKMDEGPTNILKLANKDGRTIRCSDISDSGKFLGYAIQASTRIYALSLPQNGTKTEPCLSRIKSEEKWPNIHHMKFISGTNKCLLLNQMGNVTLLNILEEEDGEFYLQKESEISRDRTKLNSGISKFHIQGEYLAVADYDDNVVVVNYESGLLISQFPKYTHAPVSSLTLSQHKTLLFISYSNGIVVECLVKTGRYTDFSNRFFSLDPKETIYDNPTRRTIRGAFYDSENEDKIIFYDSSSVYVIDKCKALEEGKSNNKKSKRVMGLEILPDENTKSLLSLKASGKYKNLLYFSRIQSDIVAVEVLNNHLEEKLPPSFKVKKFGRN